MPLPLIVLGGAVAVKTVSFLWFASRATSPLSAPWRVEFLEHFEKEISTLERSGLATSEQTEPLKADIALLRQHVAGGWSKANLFAAASRISYYRGWKHATTGIAGVGELLGSYAAHAQKSVYSAVDSIFSSSKSDTL